MSEFLASLMTFLAAQFNGNMGWAILALVLVVRLALLPLTLRLSRKMLDNKRKVQALQPQVEALKARLANDPKQLFKEMSALYKRHGAQLIDRSGLLGAFVQMPVFGLLYKAISGASAGAGPFLWIRSLASPDALLTAIVLALTALSAYYFPSETAAAVTAMMLVQVLVTAVIMWKLSAGLGLYWLASNLVSLLQTGILRLERRRLAAAVS